MNNEELAAAVKESVGGAHMNIPAEQIVRRSRAIRARRKILALAGGLTAATAVTAAAVLGLTGSFGSAPAPAAGTIRTTAFTLVKHANGTATLTVNSGVFLEPGTLQRDLQLDGIPAVVTTGSFCSSDPSPAGFSQVVTGKKNSDTVTINPAAMPVGTELSFGYFQPSSGQETAMGLIDTNSHTCASAVPTAPPSGSVGMVVHIPGPKVPGKLPLKPMAGIIVTRR
jgi:hypothetical protein